MNKTQILCNKNNKKLIIIINNLRTEIKDDLRIISNLKIEEKELLDNISNLKRIKHLRITHLYVRLGELQKFIKNFEEFSKHKQDYFKYCSSKLIIC